MKKAVIAINEKGNLFEGNFEDSPFYLIVRGKNERKKIQDCALNLSELKDYVLIGRNASDQFRNIIKDKKLDYIFLDFLNIDEALNYFEDYSNKIKVFDENTLEYEEWFDKNKYVYLSEIEALKKALPQKGRGIEIGVGSGRFAIPLGIKVGVEPSRKMGEIAKRNGIDVIFGVAENLPIDNNSFDFALMAVTICFVNDPLKSLKECYRILKPKGQIIVGIVDADTPLGKVYLKKKENSVFYKYARFFSSKEILDLFEKAGFVFKQAYQVLFGDYSKIDLIQEPKEGYGEGGFSVLVGEK
ncbi:MAG: class I SAM-dependent methyltransferase [Desulfurella sp.]|uniref:class I SAM-dependent methyltransferase n=2 Tax=Desulfurella sp. TaxID=1962857 RepID=UPI003D14585C